MNYYANTIAKKKRHVLKVLKTKEKKNTYTTIYIC